MKRLPKRFTPGGYKLRVRRSRTGRGLFAEESIPKGACIIEYVGRDVSAEEAERDAGKYLFEVGRGKTIDGNVPYNLARYINHSCDPNCEADGPSGRAFILAIKDIAPGEELAYDYGEEYFETHIEPRGCACAACV